MRRRDPQSSGGKAGIIKTHKENILKSHMGLLSGNPRGGQPKWPNLGLYKIKRWAEEVFRHPLPCARSGRAGGILECAQEGSTACCNGAMRPLEKGASELHFQNFANAVARRAVAVPCWLL